MIRISLCMIVKNEEKLLPRCLDGLCGLMDEIIIVDTGSTDGTKRVAAAYTEKIYDFPWCDDFAAARNFACEKATMEYIYSADADEVIDAENLERFRCLKECLLPEIEIVQMKYTNQLAFGTTYNYDTEYRPKLFRRLRRFSFVDPVHETLRLSPVVYDSEVEIIHLPHERHGKRDFQVFQKHFRNGLAFSEKMHIMYAKELWIAGEDADFLEAGDYFFGEYQKEPKKETLAVLARVFRLQREERLFFSVCLKDMATEGSSEVCCELGRYYEELGEPYEAAIWYYNAAFETVPVLSIQCGKQIPLSGLARIYGLLGNREEEEKYLRLMEEICIQ